MMAITILAISGSLRRASSNSAVLKAAQALAPDGVTITIFEGLDRLPFFNPDDGPEKSPPSLVAFRAAVGGSDGLLISSPEYARGVPGVMKNALDWLVDGTEMLGKKVALINTSPRATHAQESLKVTLATMATKLVTEASITLPLLGRNLDAAGILADPALSAALSVAVSGLVRAIVEDRGA
ncbi:MAG TPA: NADPH-dependent FMN reductase [Stellaceae bacterium]|nr:NADPH-dependent FMN reductase [Stellaceae bacterium]